MKRLFCLLFACVLCCFGCSALAVEDGGAAAGDDIGGSAVVTPTPTVPQPFQVEVTLIDGNPAADVTPAPDPVPVSSDDETAQTVLDSLARIEANTQGDAFPAVSAQPPVSDLDSATDEREGLAGVVSSIFGTYTPRTYTTTTYIDGQAVTATEIVPGVAGLDWPWLCGAVLFAIMLFCLFKLLGGIWR